jgi:hypothetical protein
MIQYRAVPTPAAALVGVVGVVEATQESGRQSAIEPIQSLPATLLHLARSPLSLHLSVRFKHSG